MKESEDKIWNPEFGEEEEQDKKEKKKEKQKKERKKKSKKYICTVFLYLPT